MASCIMVAAATVALAGCGTQSTGNNQTANSATGKVGSTGVTYPLHVTDQTGHNLTIKQRPTKVASATEGTDEILSALVPKKDVVLVTTTATQPAYSNVVQWAKGIPSIAQANAEQIIAAKPDIALAASYTKAGVVNQVEQAGIPVYEFTDFNSISGIESNIKIVGKLVDEEQKADNLVSTMQSQIAAIAKAVAGQQKFSVLDTSSYGYAAGSNTTVNDIIVDAGGTNVAAKLNGWAKISDEEIVQMNPEVIIDANTDSGFVKQMLADPKLQTVSAIKNHRVYVLNSADLTSVSQYVVKGVSDLAHTLYPSVKLPQS